MSEERASQVYKRSKRYLTEVTNLGTNVRALRQKKKLTLEAAAERMSLDLKHLQKVEAGALNTTMVTLVRLAEGLEVPLAELFRAPKKRPG